MVIMEDNTTKAAIVQVQRSTAIIPDIISGDNSTSPGSESGVGMNNNSNNTVSVSPSVSPSSTTEPVQSNSNSNVYLIGLEFVRQYYTVLHQGPLYLHRFYSEQSSFVHDDSNVVYGQPDIRDRIQQLNFRNCVAKILQVDSQETLGNGVVIQVRGALSNNGQPFRRFMQTFVLAPQTPKRYYVRNDIFHYQEEENPKDDVVGRPRLNSHLSNEPNDCERSEEDEETNEEVNVARSFADSPPTSATENSTSVITSTKQEETVSLTEPVTPSVPEVSLLDTKGEAKEETRPTHGFLASGAFGSSDNVGLADHRLETPKEEDHDHQLVSVNASSSGAKTFANLFKSDLTSNNSGGNQEPARRSPYRAKPPGGVGASPTSGEPSPETEVNASFPQPPVSETNSVKGMPPRPNNYNRYGQGKERRERLTSRSSNVTVNDDTGSIDGDGMRSRPIHVYPDSHQLFVGNLPHTVTAGDVKEIFEPFGRVVDVKILKPNQKNAGMKVPYFCFVVFELQTSAENAVRDKAKIGMKMPDGSHRRLNVEEKRAREGGPGFGPSGGGYFNRDSRPNDNANNSMGNMSGPYSNQNFRGGTGGNNSGSSGNIRGGGMGVRGDSGGGDYRNQNNPRSHSRTFRGTNRGNGGGMVQVGERGGNNGGGGGAR